MAAPVTAAHVAAPITHLVSVEVIEGPVTMLGNWTAVAVMWVEAVVHVPLEVVRAMEPGAGSDKDTAAEPLRPVVPVRGAAIRGVVEVTVWAGRRHSDIDCDSSRCWTRDTQDSNCQDR
jgi:hypothetical protein